MLMDIIKARHSIRKYTGEQIKRDDLEKILEALEKTKVRLRANDKFELELELLFLTIRER